MIINKKIEIYLFLIGAILAPQIRIASALPLIRPELLVVLFSILLGRTILYRNGIIPQMLALLFCIAILSIVGSYAFLEVPFNSKDFMILPMIVQYWLIFSFAKSIRSSEDRFYAVATTAALIGVSALIGIFQKLNIAGVNSWLTPMYAYAMVKEFTVNSLIHGKEFARVIGTVGDPRHFACLLVIGMNATVSLLLARNHRKKTFFYLINIFLIFIAIIFTASRTGLAALLLCLGLSLYFNGVTIRNILKYYLIIMVAIPILGWTYNRVASEAVKERFTATDSSSYKHSTGARLRDLKEPFVKGLKKPQIYLIGHGPAKAILPGSEHSDIGWMTLHFGLGGLFCYLMLLYRPFRYSLQKCHSRNILPLNKVFFIFSAEVIIVWFIYIQAESVFKLQQLMSINMFTIGLVFASINYTDDKIDQEDNQTLAIEH